MSARRKRRRGKARKSSRGALVKAYAEGISARVLVKHSRAFKAVVGRKSGIYILKKGEKVYYIGLASKLRSQLKKHLRDRHSGRWDGFSLYLIGKQRYLKDVESILIRVLRPHGNKVKGRFGSKRNLNKKLIREIVSSMKEDAIVG